MKSAWLFLTPLLVITSLAQAPAQQATSPTSETELLKQIDSFGAAPKKADAAPGSAPSPRRNEGEKKKVKVGDGKAPENPEEAKGPTEITCTKEATFDNKTRQAVFIGSVKVKDPQFTLTADKLTAILRDAVSGKAAAPNPAAPIPAPSPANGAASNSGGGLERAIAEGNVVIIQDKPGENGGPPKHYIGKAERANYDARTGDVTLTGWPQVQQGINNQIATEAGTVMILNRDGRMKTTGGNKTVIQEQAE